MRYTGSCHCGNIKFDVDGEIDNVTACNCSICQRKGILMWFVPRDKLHLQTPEETLSSYTFNKHNIKHRFCATCGIHTFGEALDPKGNAMAAVNIRCLDDIDITAYPVRHFDGKAL